MAERTAEDVKLRPLPGDEVAFGKRRYIYTVRHVSGNRRGCVKGVGYVSVVERRTGFNGQQWADYMRDAEVIHIAQSKEKTDGE